MLSIVHVWGVYPEGTVWTLSRSITSSTAIPSLFQNSISHNKLESTAGFDTWALTVPF